MRTLKTLIYTDRNNLRDLLRRLRTRRHLLLTLRGVAIALSAGAAILLLTGWAAHRYRYNETALLALRLGALITFLATVYLALVRPLWRRISDVRLARLIEEHTFNFFQVQPMIFTFFTISIIPIKTLNIHTSTGIVKTNVRTKWFMENALKAEKRSADLCSLLPLW